MRWARGLDDGVSTGFCDCAGSFANRQSQQITDNILGTFLVTSTHVSGVSLDPAELSFGEQLVGTGSAARQASLRNIGTAPLTIGSVGVSGANAAEFAPVSTCPVAPATLAPGASCAIGLTFTPAAPGRRSATLAVVDNAAGSPHTIALSGTGTLTAGQYVADGFELGLGSWAAVGTGTVAAQTTRANSGTQAAALTRAPGQFAGLYADLVGGAQRQTYSRFCAQVSGLAGTTILAQGRDSQDTTLWEVDYDAARQGLDVYLWNGAGTRFHLFSAVNLIIPDYWYCIEIQADEATSGHGEVWLNGTSVAQLAADLSVPNGYSRLYLWNNPEGSIAQGAAPSTLMMCRLPRPTTARWGPARDPCLPPALA